VERPMRSPSRALLAAAALLLLLLPASAAAAGATALLVPTPFGDADVGQALLVRQAPIRFIDGNGDSKVGADEPAYWDLDDSNDVSVDDLRLRPFLGLLPGTAVAITDLDAGRKLAGSAGWFGAAGGHWYADVDGTATVTLGDLRLADATPVPATDPEAGRPVAFPPNAQPPGRASFVDSDRDAVRDHGEPVYLDLDAGGNPSQPTVSVGDLRLAYRAATAPDDGNDEGVLVRTDVDDSASAWTPPVILAFLLGVANLVGLGAVYSLMRRTQRPRNPFK
jgi:hypothetical protein